MPRKPKKRIGRPPDTDGEETRLRILAAAEACFGEKGYAKATNGDIAEMVGLTSGSIYHHFESKAGLYAETCERANERVLATLTQAIVGIDKFVDRFVAVLQAGIDLDRDDPSLALFYVNAPAEARRHPEIADAVQRSFRSLNDFYAGLVHEGVKRGEIPPEVDTESLVGLLQALGYGLGQFVSTTPASSHAGVINTCARLVAGTLFAPQGAAAKRSRSVRRRA